MAKGKKKVVAKASPKIEETVIVSKPNLGVGSLEEAKKLLKEKYAHLDSLQFCVLENGNVFYGQNVQLGAKVAKKNGLKYFDVKY